ncbi:135_t:CDS:1, partial [Acaulospora colombiana]
MSTSDLPRCSSCLRSWNVVARARSSRRTKAGPKGTPLPRCEACHWARFKSNNRSNRNADLLPQPSKIITFAAFKEEVYLLGQQLDWKSFSAVIFDIWNGDSQDVRAIYSRISALVHEHTG